MPDRDERFTIPLDPETALRGLLRVDPTEIEPGQRWVSKTDTDDVIVIVGKMVNQDDTWPVEPVNGGDTVTITTNALLAGYSLAG